ncbi:hypothetical protein JL720_12470 [Aureococcus anophagefferens]|nr:hypothetical protein JL720_12470 [Aureococcus anophagefferens]
MAQHNDEIYEFQQHHLYGNSEPNEYWPVVTTVACPNGRWRVRYEDGSHGVVDPNRLWPAPYKKRKAGEPVWVLLDDMYYDARATGESCDDGLVEVDIDVADYYYPPDGAVQLIPAHNVYNYCAVIDNPELYSKSGLEKKAHPNYLESRAYEFNERACAKILKSCVGDDAYDGSQRQKQVAAAHARNPAPTLARDGPAVYYPWRAQLSPPRCVECGREGVETRLCMCANEGSGLGLLGGVPEVANCELLTGASTVKFLMDVLRAMTGLGSSELDAMLSRTVTMRIRKTTVIARETHFDHIVALSLRYAGAQLRGDAAKLAAPWRLDEDPAWVAGAPNGATRRVSRMEGLQLLLRKANLDKGTTISRDIVDDLLDYNTCFYAPSELAKPDVLDRTYRAESDILKRVTAWGKKRHQRLGGWYGIGDPNAPRPSA